MTKYEYIKRLSVKDLARFFGCILFTNYKYHHNLYQKKTLASFDEIEEWLKNDDRIVFNSFDDIVDWLESDVDDNDL